MDDTPFALPVTARQRAYALALAQRNGTLLPADALHDRQRLSVWIDAQARMRPLARTDALPSSKQVAFAERLARLKHRSVPEACFRDRALMSRWIDSQR